MTGLPSLASADAARVNRALKRSAATVQWIENKGQFPQGVLYGFTASNSRVFVERDRLRFEFVKALPGSGRTTQARTARDPRPRRYASHSFVVRFEGANPDVEVTHGEAFSTVYNYFQGNERSKWASGASAYKEVTLRNLYPGISLRLYSRANQQIEHDWIVAPGADYRSVKLRIEGSDGVKVSDDGSLRIALRFGQVRFEIPEAFQVSPDGRKRIGFSFAARGNRVALRSAARVDPRYPLVIDPTLAWGTWFDGNSPSFGAYLFATAVDPGSGDIYAAGYVNEAQAVTAGYLPAGGYATSSNGSSDAIVYTLSPDGKTLKYATYFGGPGHDHAYGLSLSNNAVFVAGDGGDGLPMSGASFDSSFGGGVDDGWVAVFSKSLGSLQYATYLGSTGGDRMYSIRALSDSSFVVSGIVNGPVPTSSPNYLVSAADSIFASQEGYVAKFGPLNSLTFGTYVGGSGIDTVNDVRVMADGRIAFTGQTTDPAGFPAEVGSLAPAGTSPGFVGVIPPPGGGFQYLDLIGGSGQEWFNGLMVDGDDIYWTGKTTSSNLFLGGAPGFDTTLSGDSGGDMLVARVRVPASGAPSGYKASYFGCASGCGSGQTTGIVIALLSPSCAGGTKYLAIFGAVGPTNIFGATVGSTIPTTNINGEPFFSSTNQGTWDMLIVLLDSRLGASPAFVTYAGGSHRDYFGSTGDPRGANHLTVAGDQFILGTTSHSNSTGVGQHVPQLVGDATLSQAAGSVFDPDRNNPGRDSHLIFSLSFLSYDFGDAPLSYGTQTARHRVSCVTATSATTLHLGGSVDVEGVGNPGNAPGASVDDTAGSDDEDGVTLPAGLSTADTSFNSGPITVLNNTGKPATLLGSVDFNLNGVFEAAEQASVTVPSAGSQTTTALTWSGLSGLVAGQSYARFRLTTGTIGADGTAPDGEIEDYPITITQGPPTATTVTQTTATTVTQTTTTTVTETVATTVTVPAPPPPPPPPRPPWSHGDPHLVTVGGGRYNFQGAGDFTLVRGKGVEIQVRETPVATAGTPHVDAHSELSSCVSVNTALAARVGAHRVSYEPAPGRKGGLVVYVDGRLRRLPPKGLRLGSGARVVPYKLPGGERALEIDFPNKTVVTVVPWYWALHKVWLLQVDVLHTKAQLGLLGRIRQGWLPALPTGRSLGPRPASLSSRHLQLYRTFANAWRVPVGKSLFLRGPSKAKRKAQSKWPPRTPRCMKPPAAIGAVRLAAGAPAAPRTVAAAQSPAAASAQAADACKAITVSALHADCVFDVSTTGDRSIGGSYRAVQALELGATSTSVTGPVSIAGGRSAVFVAAVQAHTAAGGSRPVGTVRFTVAGRAVGTPVPVDAAGQARIVLTLPVGTHQVAATHTPAPRSTYLASSSPSVTIVVRKPPPPPKPTTTTTTTTTPTTTTRPTPTTTTTPTTTSTTTTTGR